MSSMNIFLRIVSSFLIMAIALTVFASCSGDQAEEDTGTAPADSAQTTEETAFNRESAADNLPEKDYEGAPFRIAVTENLMFEMTSDALDGEVTNDAVYSRNSKINERFHVDIQAVPFINNDLLYTGFLNSVMAGDNAYEIAGSFAYTSYNLVSSGQLADFMKLEYIDLDKPWWNKLSNNEAAINGRLYAAVSDLCVTAMLYTYGMFFNIDLGANYNIQAEDIYSDVFKGKWTLDSLMNLTKDIYQDANGDGRRDLSDIYGYSGYHDETADMWQIAFDNPITKKDDDGLPYPALMTEKLVSALEKIITLTYDQTGSFKGTEWNGEADLFNNGTVVFVPAYFKQAFDKFRFMDAAYTILPYPKWDETQSGYYTGAMDEYTVLMIPFNAPDLEMISIITEALTVESYRTVTPAFYDIALKGKYAVDSETAEMIDIIMDGRRFDMAFMFGTSDQLQWLPYLFRKQLEVKKSDIASAYAKIEPIVTEGYKQIAEYYK
ncbi:MAG: hypothetical protein ACYCWE_15260 [Eubacteriales bacterium]